MNMVEDEEKSRTEKKKKLGGFKTLPFIFANDVCDRFAATGFHANMITYLTGQLNMPLVQASNTLTNFAGTSSLTTLIGALAADSFLGRFWTITVGSIIYELGMISITMSAILPTLRPSPCKDDENCQTASSSQLGVLYISLLLTSLGSGGLRPCVVTFGADQFNITSTKSQNKKWNYFNFYYFIMGLSTLVALTVVVYIQDNVSWGWGLGIPTMAMAFSVIAFVVGFPLYNKVKPAGSPLVRLAQVVVAAVKKRKAVMPNDSELLYENKELDAAISSHGRLVHTNELKFLDKAAIITEDEKPEPTQPNLWRLCTVHRVEELKSIIRMVPIWSCAILLVTASSHQGSFAIQQAKSMDRHLSHSFQIPAASMSIFNVLTMLIGLVAYERLFVPVARRITKNPVGITTLQRMGIGFMINILSTIVSALVEIKRKSVAAKYNLLDQPNATIPISVFWMVPQYGLHGIAEVFMSVGHMEFMYDQSPESMRSTAVALYWITISIGNYLSTLLVSLVHEYSGKNGNNWLPDRNLNKGELQNYYWLVSCIQVVNLLYYVLCAWLYTWKPLEEKMDTECKEQNDTDDDGGSVELVKNRSLSKHENDVACDEEPMEPNGKGEVQVGDYSV